jgi:predicted DsbA family dithiol-disulfide isomerase
MHTITVYSDLICPWCYIGKRHLEAALRQLPTGTPVTVRWRPFQLNPDMPREGMNRRLYRTAKFGSWERSRALDAQATAAGKLAGLEFRFDLQAHTPNTFDSHRLVWLAGQSGAQAAVVEALFRAYFCAGENLSDPATLIRLGASAGLDPDRLERFLASDQGAAAVREEEQQARRLGISGVPHFRINDAVSFSGAQPPATFLDALARTPTILPPAGPARDCGPDACSIAP